ncbi:hypothetical protein CDL15_Pgr006764 [Punica granatum]|uniref:LNS2/PITP domain-containing protein n=1 Tax=Punica granatum TaxID=22663 RepID=A0A218X706_PUNGR|nr:hypothetical protein CDL15_Pgr006764 [Punica granatum]
MNALGSLGSYISKGVYSLSGPIHPFGGAVDIIVVEQPDGSFKSSPWYVRFGKFQGVLKAKEKIVKICVNGAEASFQMHLNSKGQAYFLKEGGNEEDEEADKGDQLQDDCASPSGRRPVKSSSYNFVGSATAPASPDGTPMPRTNSDQSETMGLQRLNSLECAEIAAQLLDVNWSTSLGGSSKKDGPFDEANQGEGVLAFHIGDGVSQEKCEAISKMEEDCNCHFETPKSIKPTVSRCNRIERNGTCAYSANSKSIVAGSDTLKEHLRVKSKDHDEKDNDKKRGTSEDIGRERPGLMPKSFSDEQLTLKDLDELRTILRPINNVTVENGDMRDPIHRLSHSLDMKLNSSKPPTIFSRSYGGREGQLLRMQHDREGLESFRSSKSVPADTTVERDSKLKRTVTDKSMKVFTPTSEQLASLKLNDGGNAIIFTFCTKMLGKQQVDARIYLWKWSDRIIISDVDGTITKSDILGQCMPLVGMDWSQEGVARLYSAIKENGYQLMFLSARSISQAYITRQFLLNLKQDGKALPDGPVVISPDGLFPSLYREVIRRVPHEFKIACLEDIKALFPSDSNPFYAGFGNRDTDEISYLKVGIPKGKIFIINPKGEVVVNRHVQRKSYTSIHSLVHGMFPSMTSSEQGPKPAPCSYGCGPSMD